MRSKKKNKNINSPKKTKFTKQRKGVLNSIETKKTATSIYYGNFGLKILKSGHLRLKQIETLRKFILRFTKKYEIIWIRVLPHIPITKKPKEVRMGKGKGMVEHWVSRLKAGHILFELSHMRFSRAQMILTKVAKKLSLPSAFVFHKNKLNF